MLNKNEDIQYYEEVSKLVGELKHMEEKIFDLALDIESNYSSEEAEKQGTLIFMLWEEGTKYKAILQKLEDMEDNRKKYLEKASE